MKLKYNIALTLILLAGCGGEPEMVVIDPRCEEIRRADSLLFSAPEKPLPRYAPWLYESEISIYRHPEMWVEAELDTVGWERNRHPVYGKADTTTREISKYDYFPGDTGIGYEFRTRNAWGDRETLKRIDSGRVMVIVYYHTSTVMVWEPQTKPLYKRRPLPEVSDD